MPRPKKEEGTVEPKKRSRTGCWPCKARKVKCGEEKPNCTNCTKNGETCDYSIRLNWGGRQRRDNKDASPAGSFTFVATPATVSSANSAHEHVFSSQHIATAPPPPTSAPRPHSSSPHMKKPSYDAQTTDDRALKRVKLSPRAAYVHHARFNSQPQPLLPDHVSPGSNYFTPSSIDSLVTTPVATPGSSITSVSPYPTSAVPLTIQDPPDLRRLSVKSLVNDKPSPAFYRHESQSHFAYGYDHGIEDLDIPRNADDLALAPRSPDIRRPSIAHSDASASSADARDMAFEPGGYYAVPAAVRIPKTLEPLPAELLNNPINLMYFHHFLNHTARIMVPHDCPENPLRRVLPLMAVKNKQLLHLMLAFSASHRAKLLGQAVPSNRIADWMDDVLPALRESLSRPMTPRGNDDLSSLAPLATAIMLASLEIMSPHTFSVPITWQNHLDIARQMIKLNGGLQQISLRADGMRDNAVFLISRWFAYLDVLGSLSGGKSKQQPLDNAYDMDGGGVWLVNRSDIEVNHIDCFFGFSGVCIALLASVATLAAECDRQRIDRVSGQEIRGWRPSDEVVREAMDLRQRLENSAHTQSPVCMHTSEQRQKPLEEQEEIIATNQAFHWAGMIHISRRVLALPREHPQVQDGVQKVLEALSKVRSGSTAESCLLFPIFSAGCEATSEEDRSVFRERLVSVEGWGMQHVARARKIMQNVWETGRSWEVLVNGEFFG